MPGPPGQMAVCEQDPFGLATIEALNQAVTKLETSVKYNFVRTAGKKYFVSDKEKGSFFKAVEFCSQQGLELALPQNEEENNLLTQAFDDVDQAAWINVNDKKAKGNFEVDMKERPLTFTRWGPGQPDVSVESTGCTMVSEHGHWVVTTECSFNAIIICQL
ncbi:mannose-binding protein C-like [Aulostomus maculatus]